MAEPIVMRVARNEDAWLVEPSMHQENLRRLADAVRRRHVPEYFVRGFVLMSTFTAAQTQRLQRCG